MHKVKPPAKIPPQKLLRRRKPPKYTISDLTEAARAHHDARMAGADPEDYPVFNAGPGMNSQPQNVPFEQQENQDINDIIGGGGGFYNSGAQRPGTEPKQKGKKKIIPLNIDQISPQLMQPGQKEAQERLFKPQKFTNDPPPYHPDAYKKAGMPVPPESMQHHQNHGDDAVEEEMSMDDFGQRAEMEKNEDSAPTILSYDPNDPDKKF